jgi:O-antigen/teichoic acid export membrane protein
MAAVKSNIVANFLGSGWNALMGLAFIPLYIHYLGMEAYGLIGAFVLLQAWLALLDLGLTPTISREMARFDAGTHNSQSIRDLVCSVEWIYVLTAGAIALGVTLASPWLATNWLQAESLSTATVVDALTIAGGVIAVRWLAGLYRSAIIGLQRQVWLNGCTAIFATLRGMGVVAVLAWVSPTIQAFFVYQGVLFALEALALAIQMRRLLPAPPQPARFSWQALRQVWHFAAGMTVITLLSIGLTQIDKLLLSRLLSLTDFGYYVLASSVVSALYMLIYPINYAASPRLTELVASGDAKELVRSYHSFSQILTLSLVPAALVLSLFSDHVLLLWTRDASITCWQLELC